MKKDLESMGIKGKLPTEDGDGEDADEDVDVDEDVDMDEEPVNGKVSFNAQINL